MERERERERERNYGICVLRILMAFQVVMGHAGGGPWFRWLVAAVPFFMLTAFYLTASTFTSLTSGQIKRRMVRICVPYFSYAFLSYIVISFFNVMNNKSIVPLKDLVWQMFLGSSPILDPPLWFLFDLIICSITLFLISKYIIYRKLCILLILLASFFFQYTGINFFLFSWMPYEAKWSLGRLLEMFPYACGGLLLAESQILKKYAKNILLIFSIVILILFFRSHPLPAGEGFAYQGLYRFIIALLIFSLFYLGNLEKLNISLKRIILYVSSYSLGIYCIHYIIIIIANNFPITVFSPQSSLRGILIYLLSLALSILIGKIPSKWASCLVK